MGIMALVWVNISSNTTNRASGPSGNHNASEKMSAAVAP
jgi:hypothetical protein